MAILLVIAFILACVGVEYYRTRQRKRIVEKTPIVINPAYQLKYDKVKIPQGIYFGGSHAWAYLGLPPKSCTSLKVSNLKQTGAILWEESDIHRSR